MSEDRRSVSDEFFCHGYVGNAQQNGRIQKNDWSGGIDIKYEEDVQEERCQKLDVLVEVQQNK